MEPLPPKDPRAVLPPEKHFLTAEQLDELWNLRGMKYRVDELHVALLNRGLGIYVDRPMFRRLIHDLLEDFLVNGKARRDPKWEPRTRFPKVF
jgi:hypothetical protein